MLDDDGDDGFGRLSEKFHIPVVNLIITGIVGPCASALPGTS